MKDNLQLLREKVRDSKQVVLSVDLDDTLVNREMGPNYITPNTFDAFKNVLAKKNTITLINTGRERYGYESFCRDAINVKNAILGAGSVIEHKGEYNFDPVAEIESNLLKAIFNLIKKKKLPFADMAYFYDRSIVHNLDRYSILFFSQNPAGWFDVYPKISHVDEGIQYDKVFRIEFPIVKSEYPNLFNDLADKRKNCFPLFQEILGSDVKLNKEYLIKRKSFFKEQLRDEVVFARLEVNETVVNKGTGLKLWFEKSGLNAGDCTIIHIGDKDHGVVNDTIIKSVFPESIIAMVGDDFDKKNPLVDLYLEGNIDNSVRDILNAVAR